MLKLRKNNDRIRETNRIALLQMQLRNPLKKEPFFVSFRKEGREIPTRPHLRRFSADLRRKTRENRGKKRSPLIREIHQLSINSNRFLN